MTDAPDAPRLAQTYDEVEDALLSRWPETKLEPSLDRLEAFTELLGEPQHSFRSIHLTGTNGKTSTSRMIETLLRALDLRTGRFTSPHLERMSERITEMRLVGLSAGGKRMQHDQRACSGRTGKKTAARDGVEQRRHWFSFPAT